MIGWDEAGSIRQGDVLRSQAYGGHGQGEERDQATYRGRRWKRVSVDDLGVDECLAGAGEEQGERQPHQMRPISHYLERRAQRVVARLTTPEELAAQCVLWVVQAGWDEGEWRAQERLFQQWQLAGILLEAHEVTLERRRYLTNRLRGLAPQGLFVMQEWCDQIAPGLWDLENGQLADRWGEAWAEAGVDCALIGHQHPLWGLMDPMGPHVGALGAGMARAGMALGRRDPDLQTLVVGIGLGAHASDWKRIASRDTVRWAPPRLRPLRLLDCSGLDLESIPQMFGEFDGLLVREGMEQLVAVLAAAVRDQLLTEQALLDRAYRFILLREWTALVRQPETAAV